MKKKLSRLIFLLFSIFIIVLSCRSEDFENENSEKPRTATEFFKHSRKTNEFSKTGVDYVSILETYNTETDFIHKMPDQEGMPIWDKMQVYDAEEMIGLIIPLSIDNETLSSILFATLDSENHVVYVSNITNTLLQDFVCNKEIDKNLRESLFYTFMVTDKKTFGNDTFINIPQDLFEGLKDGKGINSKIIIKDFATVGSPKAENRMIYVEQCFFLFHCKGCPDKNDCDLCGICLTRYCQNILIPDIDIILPIPPRTGGGSPPPLDVPLNPCTNARVFYRAIPNCGGNGGGGIDDELENPCKKIKKTYNKNAGIKTATQNLGTKITESIEYGFGVLNTVTPTTANPIIVIPVGSKGKVEIPLYPANPFMIIAHTHNAPKDSTYSVPSWDDLDGLSFAIQKNQNFADVDNLIFMAITADGTRYAMMIDDITAFTNYFYQEKLFAEPDYDLFRNRNINKGKYYSGTLNPITNTLEKPKIQENSTDKEQDLKYFMEIANNAGLKVFEMDSSFSNFTQVTLNNNQIQRKDCN